MAYEMVMPYHLHMPSYFLETFTEYPTRNKCRPRSPIFHKTSLYKRGQEMTLVS